MVPSKKLKLRRTYSKKDSIESYASANTESPETSDYESGHDTLTPTPTPIPFTFRPTKNDTAYIQPTKLSSPSQAEPVIQNEKGLGNLEAQILFGVGKELKCPRCFKLPVNIKVYSCTDGHSICENCYEKDALCQVEFCSGQYNGTRSRTVEAVVNQLKVQCNHEGCEEFVLHTGMEEHSKKCQYRPIPCFETREKRCQGALIEQQEFTGHLRSHHNIIGVTYRSFLRAHALCGEIFSETDIEKDSSQKEIIPKDIHYIEVENTVFLRNIAIKGDCVYFWVTYLGPEEKAGKFYTTINLISEPCYQHVMLPPDKKTITWLHSIHSHHKAFPEVQKFGDYASINKEDLWPYLKRSGDGFKLNVSYEIKQRVNYYP